MKIEPTDSFSRRSAFVKAAKPSDTDYTNYFSMEYIFVEFVKSVSLGYAAFTKAERRLKESVGPILLKWISIFPFYFCLLTIVCQPVDVVEVQGLIHLGITWQLATTVESVIGLT